MDFDFATVLVYALLAAGFVVLNLLVGRWLFRPPSGEGREKRSIYECGEPTIGSAWIRFDIRFYTVALMFVVFDVEVALLFPWGRVVREFVENGQGWVALGEALAFIVVLMAGLVYVWARGDLEWTPKAGERPNTTDRAHRPERAGRVVAPRRVAGAAVPSTEAPDAD